MREFGLKSFDGTDIFVTLWDDVSSPKAVLQISHGMSEYAGRYDRFARYMNSRGYIVFADDHRAHGRTETGEERGRHKGNIFDDTLKDLIFFREWLKEEYGLPVFFLGHSYGSFLGQAFAQAGTDVKAIALLGTAYMKGLSKLTTILIAPLWLVARNWRPKIVNKIADSFFKYEGDSGKCQWITSVKANREEYISNPLTGTHMSLNFDFCAMNGTSKLYSKKAISKLNPTASIGIFCGAEDPVGGFCKSVIKLHKMYTDNGIKSEIKLYEGARHEILNDKCYEEASRDIADFFDKFIIYSQTSIDDLQ